MNYSTFLSPEIGHRRRFYVCDEVHAEEFDQQRLIGIRRLVKWYQTHLVSSED